MKLKTFFGIVFLFIFNVLLSAQQDSSKVSITELSLKDGATLKGNVVEENDSSLIFKTLNGLTVNVPLEKIKSRKFITGTVKNGQFWPADPNRTRLFLAPTGKSLKAGQGYFAAYEIFFPFAAVGITDNFILAGGMSLIPGATSQIFYFAPKVTPYQTDNFSVAAGGLFFFSPLNSESMGILYSVGTFDFDQNSATMGIGMPLSTTEGISEYPIILAGGEIRVGRSLKIITENWFSSPLDGGMLSLGIRFFGANLAVDFAFIYPLSGMTTGFPFIPWIGFAYNL